MGQGRQNLGDDQTPCGNGVPYGPLGLGSSTFPGYDSLTNDCRPSVWTRNKTRDVGAILGASHPDPFIFEASTLQLQRSHLTIHSLVIFDETLIGNGKR